MSGRDWFAGFVAQGPGYDGQRFSLAEVQALLMKAGRGAGLPLGHAQDLSGLSGLLMSDPQLLAMATAALDGHHRTPTVEGTDEHVVLERADILMAGPMVVDFLISGAKRIVLHDLDWPLLMWPYLAHAQIVYRQYFEIEAGNKGTVMVMPAASNMLDEFGAQQPVPHVIVERLEFYAAKTYVPATEASRQAGAGAGLSDND